jgi:opacity protein-like surface antigen
MRIKALLLISAVAAMAAPSAFAQSRSCQEVRQNNQVGGAIVGSILGGILGSNVAASGHRSDGTAVGAVLGGMIGAGAGGNVRCAPPQGYSYGHGGGPGYTPNPTYGSQHYGDARYGAQRYGDDPYLDGGLRQGGYHPDLYPNDRRAYTRDDDFAGADCTESIQVTRLPDGSQIRRPVEVCRDAYYGEWRVID